MVAVRWPSSQRKAADGRRPAIVEVKYGDSALTGRAGLAEHISDANSFLGNSDKVDDLKKDMISVFNQKRRLGLMDCRKDLKSFSNERPVLLLALVNHDPNKTASLKTLRNLPESPDANLRIGTASFFGCGLYDQGSLTFDQLCRRFGDYVHKDILGVAQWRSNNASASWLTGARCERVC